MEIMEIMESWKSWNHGIMEGMEGMEGMESWNRRIVETMRLEGASYSWSPGRDPPAPGSACVSPAPLEVRMG
jgi:hypothetical protein